jgi:hypothetical protein
MSLTITFRPQKDLYAENPPDAYDTPYYNSRWVSGHLPVQYKILNTKWPENADDDVDNVCAVTEVNGYAQINLCGTYETYQKYEYIKIENSSVDSYNGVWQIIDKLNATTFTLSAAYDGNATGTAQRYYNNYFNYVKVYAGIPSYHQYTSEDPMSLIATLKIAPNADNITIADISGLVKAKLNCDNDLDQISTPNDLNAWTGFYIEYAESYDVSDGLEVTTYTSAYTTDEVTEDCGINVIENGDFVSNLNGWVNGDTGTPGAVDWVYGSNRANATKGAGNNTKALYQLQDFIQGVQYTIQVTAINSTADAAYLYIQFYEDSTLLSGMTVYDTALNASGSTSISFTYIPDKDYGVIAFVGLMYGSGQVISIDNISATLTDCTYYGFAINGTRQFQNAIGGNFGDYVQSFNNHVYNNKFLTLFTRPVWFNDLYFDLSTIIPKSTFDSNEDGTLYYKVNEYTESGGFLQRQDITLQDKNDGVYRLPISDLTLDEDTENITVQLYQLPTNRFEDATAGTFEGAAADWNLTEGSGVEVTRVASGYLGSGFKGSVEIFGPDLVGNGDFSSSTGWSAFTGWSIGAGAATHIGGAGGQLIKDLGIVQANTYRVTITVTSFTPVLSDSILYLGNLASSFSIAGVGTYTQNITVVGASNGFIGLDSRDDITVDDITVKLVGIPSENLIFEGTNNMTVQAYSDYVAVGYVYFPSAIGTSSSNGGAYLLPTGSNPIGSYVAISANGSRTVLILDGSVARTAASSTGSWVQIKTNFNTGNNTSLKLQVNLFGDVANYTSQVAFYIDSITVKGPIENLSEAKSIRVDNSCTKQNIYLTWLNNLGAWEYWNFTAQKDYGVDISGSKTITRDIFNNWDTDFINGETEEDYISFESVNETIVVRSQFMTLEELQGVKNIKTAIRVQQIRSDNTKVTVLVDKASFKTYSDGNKLYQIEFEFKYPRTQIQAQ